MRNTFNYWLTDFAISILTLDSFVFKRLISSAEKDYGDKSILDIGCGTGSQAPLFSKRNYVGIDIDQKAIEYAKTRFAGYKFIQADAAKFDLKKKFDYILIVGLLHHLDNKKFASCMLRSKKHLKQDGKLVIIEAIPPIFRFNFIGAFLRNHDRGNHIRRLEQYTKVISVPFDISISKRVFGGLFDYAFIVANQK